MNTKVISAIGLFIVNLTAAADLAVESAEDVKAAAEAVVEDRARISDEVQRRLKEIIAHTQSPEWANNQNKWRQSIENLTGTTPAVASNDNDDKADTNNEDRLIVFVSSSVPLATMRNYAKDLEKVKGLMVLRGMVGGMRAIKPTLRLIASILRINPSCEQQRCSMRKTAVVIDPILFRDYGINKVPAAVYVENMALGPYCERSSEQLPRQRQKHVVYGDLSLKSLAEELRRLSRSPRLDALIGALER